jgi:hypothetical protein
MLKKTLRRFVRILKKGLKKSRIKLINKRLAA